MEIPEEGPLTARWILENPHPSPPALAQTQIKLKRIRKAF
jgi:hypothetical protein